MLGSHSACRFISWRFLVCLYQQYQRFVRHALCSDIRCEDSHILFSCTIYISWNPCHKYTLLIAEMVLCGTWLSDSHTHNSVCMPIFPSSAQHVEDSNIGFLYISTQVAEPCRVSSALAGWSIGPFIYNHQHHWPFDHLCNQWLKIIFQLCNISCSSHHTLHAQQKLKFSLRRGKERETYITEESSRIPITSPRACVNFHAVFLLIPSRHCSQYFSQNWKSEFSLRSSHSASPHLF